MADSGLRESFFSNTDGKKIYCRYWCEDLENPRALVLIAHGVAEHCLWYTPLAQEMKEIGCYVFSHDHVGHGQSEGARVHVNDFHEYVRDVFHHFDSVAEKFPGVPKILIGHSMGGAVAVLAAIEKPDYFDGIVLIAPAVKADHSTVGPVRIFLGKIVAHVFPQFPVLRLDTSNVCRDPAVVARYLDDPLVYHGGLKARWGASLLEHLKKIKENLATITCPMLALHGTGDKLTLWEGSRWLIDNISSKDKTLKTYEGFFHQLHYEPGKDGAGVRRDIKEWITSHVK